MSSSDLPKLWKEPTKIGHNLEILEKTVEVRSPERLSTCEKWLKSRMLASFVALLMILAWRDMKIKSEYIFVQW